MFSIGRGVGGGVGAGGGSLYICDHIDTKKSLRNFGSRNSLWLCIYMPTPIIRTSQSMSTIFLSFFTIIGVYGRVAFCQKKIH